MDLRQNEQGRGGGNGTYISGDVPDNDHRNHNAEEDDDNGRVDETEPMDSRVEDVEVIVPASRPGCIRFLCRWLAPTQTDARQARTFQVTLYVYFTVCNESSSRINGRFSSTTQLDASSWFPPILWRVRKATTKFVHVTSQARQGLRLRDRCLVWVYGI